MDCDRGGGGGADTRCSRVDLVKATEESKQKTNSTSQLNINQRNNNNDGTHLRHA